MVAPPPPNLARDGGILHHPSSVTTCQLSTYFFDHSREVGMCVTLTKFNLIIATQVCGSWLTNIFKIIKYVGWYSFSKTTLQKMMKLHNLNEVKKILKIMDSMIRKYLYTNTFKFYYNSNSIFYSNANFILYSNYKLININN